MEEEAANASLVQGPKTKKRKKRQAVGADEDEQDERTARRKRPRTSSPSMASIPPVDSDDDCLVVEVSTPDTSPPSISGKGSPLSSRATTSALSDEESFGGASPVERRRLQRRESLEEMDLSEEEPLITTRRPTRRVVNLSDEEDE